MSDNDLRRAIIHNLDRVRALLLTSQQWEILAFIYGNSPILSSDISAQWSLSASHTANVMTALYLKGYVRRLRRASESGGNEYEYKIKAELI